MITHSSAAIKGFSETLFGFHEISESQKDPLLKKIFKNSLRLKLLVDDLLNLSELEGN